MKYIVTGATSFLGQEMILALAQTGAQVVAVCRDKRKLRVEVATCCTIVELLLKDYGQLPDVVDKADVLIHLAWEGTGHDGRDATLVQQENVAYSLDAMRAAAKMGCKLFVMAGSQAEYGITMEPQKEDMVCEPFSEYGKAKLRMWNEGSMLADELGMKYLHLRIFSLFGEHDHPWTLVMSAVDKMLRNDPMELSPCTQNWNFLYVKDAAQQIIRLCNHALQTETFGPDIYNIASDDTRPLRAFVEEMRVITNSHSDLHYGAVIPQQIVSLQPDMTKTRQTVSVLSEYDFKKVIERIIDRHHDKSI